MRRMETRVGPQTPYEVYCYPCRVTFPTGTRTCIHCGRPIGMPAFASGALPTGPGPGPVDAEDAGPGGIDPLSAARKLGGVSLWVLIAVAAAVSRLCNGS
jgi:hypothetical protein